MDMNEIQEYLIDFQKKDFPKLIERKLDKFSKTKINAIIGPRRAGKTSYMYQVMKSLKKEDVLYLDFENIRLIDVGFKDIIEVVRLHERLYGRPVIFLDEPQNVEKWESAVRNLHDLGYRIFISGSSSKLLSKEIATSLRGRSLSYLLLPFSFKEFLAFNGWAMPDLVGSQDKQKIFSYLDEYMRYGGFPEVILEDEVELKLKIIENYLELTVQKDIMERHNIKDTFLIRWLIKSIASTYSKEMSVNKLYLTLKSQGKNVSKNELYAYVSMINDSFFAFFLPQFSHSVRKRKPIQKTYLCDVGFSMSADSGKKMENLVFLELTRKLEPGTEIFYWKNVQQEEVDFVVRKGTRVEQLIQVCYDYNPENKKREVRSLLKAGKELDCKNLIMITNDLEDEQSFVWFGIKGKVRFVPLWRWITSS